jgi:uncharacterized protein (TIGR03437 family)
MMAFAALILAIPLHFEPVAGQARAQARYVAMAPQYRLSLSDTGIDMQFLHGGSVRMNIPRAVPEAAAPRPGKTNYYSGGDPAIWRTGIPNYARVRYRSVFRGVDLVVYGDQREIEYDWVVRPGADPAAIRFSFTGAAHMRVDANGDLVLEAAGREIRHRKPCVYQAVDGHRREIQGEFLLARNGQVRFRMGAYDKRRTLTIDPQLVYSTGFGGSGLDATTNVNAESGTGIAVDRNGNAYIAGIAYSTDFPLVNSLEAVPYDFYQAVFIAKLSADGSTLLYSTYVALNNDSESPLAPPAIAVDSNGNAYVTGDTNGSGFPTVGGGSAVNAGYYDAFLLALNPNGILLASQTYGGSGQETGTSIALGPDGNLYLAGTTSSPNFPTTAGAYGTALVGAQDLFLMKINPRILIANIPGSQSPIVYSTYLGAGSSAAVAADAAGNAYVSGTTTSTAWAATPGVFQPKCAGQSCADAVALKVNPSGNQLLYTTYFGGSGTETVGGLAIDQSGNAYISGSTTSPDLPTTSGAFQAAWRSPTQGQTAFVAKLNPGATKLAYATYLGGSVSDQAYGIAVDGSGNAYVAGETTSPDFPIANAIEVSLANPTCVAFSGPPFSIPIGEAYCPSAGFVSVLNPAGAALVWSTFLGSASVYGADSQYRGPAYAVVLDSAGNVYATGQRIGIDDRIAAQSPSDAVGVVKIAQQGNPLQFPADGLTNGASFLAGLPAPGGLASLFLYGVNVSGTVIGTGDPLPTELEGVSIFVGGFPAPILAVANIPVSNPLGMQQINFQVPFEAQTNLVEVRYLGLSTFVLPQEATPGIFTLPGGLGAIQHASDYSLVTASNPASPGETIIIYATGLGPVSTPVADGIPAPGADPVQQMCQPASVIFGGGGIPANVPYAGLTPGYTGLYQMNVQVPPNIPAGPISLYIFWAACGPDAGFSNIVMLPVE